MWDNYNLPFLIIAEDASVSSGGVLLLASSLQYSVSQRELSEWALFDTNQNGGRRMSRRSSECAACRSLLYLHIRTTTTIIHSNCKKHYSINKLTESKLRPQSSHKSMRFVIFRFLQRKSVRWLSWLKPTCRLCMNNVNTSRWVDRDVFDQDIIC